MGNIIDLRKYNIRTEEDAIEFLELFVSKAPQLAQVLKDQRFKRASLQNRLDQALKAPAAAPEYADENASVLDRMTGKGQQPAPTVEQSRIAQLKAAQSTAAMPTTAPPAPAQPDGDDELPPAPVAPGEIGQLNVPTIDPKAPVDDPNSSLATSEATPTGDTITESQTANAPVAKSGGTNATEEEAVAAGGSKSEHSTDDGVQPEDTAQVDDNPPGEPTELTDEEKAALQADSSTPTEDDVTPVGTKIAKKTAKKKK